MPLDKPFLHFTTTFIDAAAGYAKSQKTQSLDTASTSEMTNPLQADQVMYQTGNMRLLYEMSCSVLFVWHIPDHKISIQKFWAQQKVIRWRG